jgi:hypothetical protein
MKLKKAFLGTLTALLASSAAQAFTVNEATITPRAWSWSNQYGTYYENQLILRLSGGQPGNTVQIDNNSPFPLRLGAFDSSGSFNLNYADFWNATNSYDRKSFRPKNDCSFKIQSMSGYYSVAAERIAYVSPCQVFTIPTSFKIVSVVNLGTWTRVTATWNSNLPATATFTAEDYGTTTPGTRYEFGPDILTTSHRMSIDLLTGQKYSLKAHNTDGMGRYQWYGRYASESQQLDGSSNVIILVDTRNTFQETTPTPTPSPSPTPVASPTPTPAPSPTPTPVASATISGMKATCSTSLRKITITGTLSANMYMQFRNSSGSWVAIGGSPTLKGAFTNSISSSSCPLEVRVRDKNRTTYVVRAAVTRVP